MQDPSSHHRSTGCHPRGRGIISCDGSHIRWSIQGRSIVMRCSRWSLVSDTHLRSPVGDVTISPASQAAVAAGFVCPAISVHQREVELERRLVNTAQAHRQSGRGGVCISVISQGRVGCIVHKPGCGQLTWGDHTAHSPSNTRAASSIHSSKSSAVAGVKFSSVTWRHG